MGHRLKWPVLLALIMGLGPDIIHGQGNTCADGWSYHADQCYLARDEYETFKNAEITCELFGASMAYANDQSELTFIKSLIGKNTNYGWWYGAKVRYNNLPLVYDKEKGYYVSPPDGVTLPLPKDTTQQAPSTTCIGLSADGKGYYAGYTMVDVPCRVSLPYVCRGSPSTTNVPKGDMHYTQNGTDVYWFSSLEDRRSYDSAVKICQSKGMTLLSVGGLSQMSFIMSEFAWRQDKHVDPWWIGLQVNNGVYTWSSGVPVESEIINGDKRNSRRYYSKYPCRILLTDGTMDDIDCQHKKAPFICKRHHIATGQFGCPHLWSRAGQSCYIQGTQSNLKYEEAANICTKMGAHPISVDTPLEKLWLKQSVFFEDHYYNKYWTSLNDRKQSGHFVWANGKSPTSDVVTWSAGTSLNRKGQCFTLNPTSTLLRRNYCSYNQYLGCQHPASGPADCVTNNWKYFKGNCYFSSTKRDSYLTMLHGCYADALTKNNDITIYPLKVDSTDVMNFYAKNMVKSKWSRVWIGLQQTSKGTYAWSDGTVADITIFKTDYNYQGTDISTSKCAVINKNGDFEAKSCSTWDDGAILCEKELSYSGSGNSATSHMVAPTLVTLLALLTFSRFLTTIF